MEEKTMLARRNPNLKIEQGMTIHLIAHNFVGNRSYEILAQGTEPPQTPYIDHGIWYVSRIRSHREAYIDIELKQPESIASWIETLKYRFIGIPKKGVIGTTENKTIVIREVEDAFLMQIVCIDQPPIVLRLATIEEALSIAAEYCDITNLTMF